MTTPDVLEAAKLWMQPCGRHDADLMMACSCPDGDPRLIVSRLAAELEAARREIERGSETRRATAIGAVRRLCRRDDPFAVEVLKVLDAALNGGDRS